MGASRPSFVTRSMAFLREPLVLFMVIGAALFVLAGPSDEELARTITIGSGDRERLTALWEAQMRRPPTEAELASLIDDHIREEIYYREARNMGLDENDTIIRRRLAQKLQFLTEDMAVATNVADETLQQFHAEHKANYREARKISFAHVYLSENNLPAELQQRLTQLQAQLAADDSAEGWRKLGDPFMLRRQYVQVTEQQVTNLFGGDFAQALFALQAAPWQETVRSAYGHHLVAISDRVPARDPDFAQVRGEVLEDYRAQQRKLANQGFYDALKERYVINVTQDDSDQDGLSQ